MQSYRRPFRLEYFRFSSNHENALSLCFHAIPNAKPLHTFAGIALRIRPCPIFSTSSPTSKAFPSAMQPTLRSVPVSR
ncbi:hypothetical protein E0H35_12760 [Rhizobium leguminosarum bv. viciae]|nr:hypothetical protein [Rhizobium leguminosarum bv. viciae]RWY89971.1 hypothetical protein EHI44_06375 [Rhizobium leguminosarum]TAU86142.1 hypothetical protein ELI40_24020 [Rhizobium leguminosarum]TAU91304.1 hypothetical protein ELI41_23575 [Rhizobium leguminosarum]TAV51249.1 hypothetical protein ELI32_25075 [Rhizobium leguminosarum]